jgi:hypothetical protein
VSEVRVMHDTHVDERVEAAVHAGRVHLRVAAPHVVRELLRGDVATPRQERPDDRDARRGDATSGRAQEPEHALQTVVAGERA